MIDTIIFDIGKVLVGASWKDFCQARGLSPADQTALEDVYWGTHLWEERDLGVMTEDQIKEAMRDRARERGCLDLFEEVDAAIGQVVTKKPYAKPWIRDLKARGYRVLYLSNYGWYIMQANYEALDFLPIMDGGIFSCDAKLVKPDRAIFALIRDRWALHPDRAVFLDDRPENVEAAQSMGFHGIVFADYDQAQAQLEALLADQ
jgi:putative hydrolase of the HAD superfamily